MNCCHSIPGCCNLFSGVKLSIKWFCFIFIPDQDESVINIGNNAKLSVSYGTEGLNYQGFP